MRAQSVQACGLPGQPQPLPVGGRDHAVARPRIHEVRAHRRRALGIGGDHPHVGAAAAQDQRLDRHRRARRRSRITVNAAWRAGDAGGGVEAQHVGVASGGRGVEVGRAPHAAVDVLAAADLHRREQPRHRARGLDRLGDASARGAPGAAEHDPPALRGRRRRRAGARRTAPRTLDAGPEVGEGPPRGGGPRRSIRERTTAPPGAATPSASGANVAPAAIAEAPARRAARSAEVARP